eukprot:13920808-Alexandrium_andersonii.AAC.1
MSPRHERSSAAKPAALAALRMAALARHRPIKVLTSTETSSTKAGVGARLAENAATTIGANAKRQRKGLIGPPTPTP